MGLIESYRANGGIDDDQGLDRLYPGGDYFDPLGLADDPDSFAELRVRPSQEELDVSPHPSSDQTTIQYS